MSEEKKKKKPAKDCPPGKDGTEFRIRNLPDMRRLRGVYLKKGEKPIGMDSNDTPRPEDDEEDFGLKRSTDEEAWEFLRDATCGEDHLDDMTEFLDDDQE